MQQILALILARALQVLITGGVRAAVQFLNRNFAVVAAADGEGRELTAEEHKAITDDIEQSTAVLAKIDTTA